MPVEREQQGSTVDNSRELARLLRKAQQVHLEKTRPPIWMVTNKYQGEETLSPPDGVPVFEPWLVFSCEGERPEGDSGKPIGNLCPMQ